MKQQKTADQAEPVTEEPISPPTHGISIIGPFGGPNGITGIHIQCHCGWKQTGPAKATHDGFLEHLAQERGGTDPGKPPVQP